MIVLGISAYYHDSAAAIVRDGTIVAAAEEERFNRIKHYCGFPTSAINFCLSYTGLTINDIDKVVFYEKPFLKFERIIRSTINYAPKSLRTFLTAMPIWLKERLNLRKTIITELRQNFGINRINVEFSLHHLSHAAWAFYASPFDHCAILCIDAVGENSTTSIFKASNGGIELIASQQFPHSVGLLYSSFTYYLGFRVNSEEYKVMGLAPYGDEKSDEYRTFKQIIIQNLVDIRDNGSIRLHDNYFSFMYSDVMVKDSDWNRLFGLQRRRSNEPITTSHMNLAKAIQDITEEIIIKMAHHALNITNEHYLCVVGGCALNCAAMGKLKKASIADKVFVPFAPGDNGAAIGCALHACNLYTDSIHPNISPYLGNQYIDQDIRIAIEQAGLSYEYLKDFHAISLSVAKDLSNGKIVGWFQGRMEFGPRALGNRSILADPRNPKTKDIINSKVKFRESFRPFAPAILEDCVSEYFDINDCSPYMASTFNLKSIELENTAVIHIDGSARLQTVSNTDNPLFYDLIQSFYKLTGCPLILNTSFNVMGEPIVFSPYDAITTFLKTGIDTLVMGKFVIKKQ